VTSEQPPVAPHSPKAGKDPNAAVPLPAPIGSAWEPLRVPVFRALWLASVTSNIGTWAHDVGAAWLMTSMTTSPLMVSLLQTAASVPIFMLALPAGALADLVDRRRLLIIANLAVTATAVLLAVASLSGAMSPELLLAFTFALGVGAAFNNPAWQATIPEVVPERLVPAATTLNGVNINLARALGPALGGFIVAAAGPPAVFILNAVATAVIVVIMWRWQGQARVSGAPPERLTGAMWAGLRFVRFSKELRPVLIRALSFIICGSAVWALLPILARQQLGLGATQYGFLLGALGAGAVLASNFLPAWRRWLNVDRLVVVASLALAALFVLVSINRSYPIALLLMFVVGMAWIALMPTFNVAAIQALPKWVRARGLALYNVIYQGGTAAGGIVWGTIATVAGVPTALMIAAGGLAAGVLLAPLFPLRRVEDVDLSPAGHWPTIEGLVSTSEAEAGPVLVTVEYQIDPAKRDEFLRLVHDGRSTRRRDGAYAWGIYQDTEDQTRFVEEFLVASWSEHVRQHTRVTKHDQQQEALAREFHIGPEKPRVRHYLYGEASRQRDERVSPGAE
jgi:MFS family permease